MNTALVSPTSEAFTRVNSFEGLISHQKPKETTKRNDTIIIASEDFFIFTAMGGPQVQVFTSLAAKFVQFTLNFDPAGFLTNQAKIKQV